MNKLVLAFAALLVIIGFVSWNVWHAVYEPVTTPPSMVELGRQHLHDQLEHSKAREADIEKQDWGSITLLRGLIDAHKHRIDQLKDNSQAGEIVAHDRDAIARIEQRIADLEAQQAAQAAAATDAAAAGGAEDSAVAGSSAAGAVVAPKNAPSQPPGKPAQPLSARPADSTTQAVKQAQKTQTPAAPKGPPQTR